jgi:amidase
MKYTFPLFCIAVPVFIQAQTSPRLIHFIPTSFSNNFTINREPVLTIASGDTVQTETIDAFGRDKDGIRRQGGGNPLTGPFYIKGVNPGDVLAITLTEVAFNRTSAYTSEAFVPRSLPKSGLDRSKKTPIVKWRLDLQHNLGWPDSSFHTYEHLKTFKVALHPFPGCIGVAPMNKKNEIRSFFQGPFGGNLDYNLLTKGTTIYLPVFHPGAYLYIGDGHAAQGDGEIAGNALETSLDITFTVRVIQGDSFQLTYPRAEDATYIMALASAKKLEDALQLATAGLLDWLQKDYQLTLPEATQVMSTTIQYNIAEIADPGVLVVAKIRKEALKDLQRK